MWIRLASKCGAAMRVETLAAGSSADASRWIGEQVAAMCAAGASGPLYVFLKDPPDQPLAEALRAVTVARRLQPSVVAASGALPSRHHLELLQYAGVPTLYVTLHGPTAATHDVRTGEPGSWRRALLLLTTAPRLIERVRLGVHMTLSPQSADEVPSMLRLTRKTSSSELLLWDAGCTGMDGNGLDPPTALRGLDAALVAAQTLGIRVRPIGFERTRAVSAPTSAPPCIATGTIIGLLREGIALPSAGSGLLASDGASAPILEAAPSGPALSQIAFELAACGRPFLDLPSCLGGPPPERQRRHADNFKVDACAQCPIDARCSGAPQTLIGTAGVHDEMRPPPHWLPVRNQPRVLVMCTVVSDALYGATFFRLARGLVELGAKVDVVSPWAIHADIDSSFAQRQPPGEPETGSAIDAFIRSGPMHQYDLVLAPYIRTARMLFDSGRLRPDTRLATTDFHMLGGMYEWARDVCPSGRRPEEGGWWPSDQIVLYSAFPGYAPLYTRYGVPLRQVAWQPFAVDPASFPFEIATTEATAIVSGGNHRRDVATLMAAAARLSSAVHPIDLFTQDEVPAVPPQVRFRGAVPTANFCPIVGRSRFMVVPLLDDPYNAAGITAMVTALMYGRPIIATSSPASRDYIQDGYNGLVVPPSDPKALAEAIERLDSDGVLLANLAAGAVESSRKFSAQAWARALLHGSDMYDASHWLWTR